MSARRGVATRLGAACTAVILAAGCGSEVYQTATPIPLAAGAHTDTAVATAPTGMLALLAAVPDTPEARSFIRATDLVALRSAAGVQTPPHDAPAEVAEQYLAALATAHGGRLPEIAGMSDPLAVDAWRTELGFSVLDLTRSARIGTGETSLVVFATRRSPEELDAALRSDPVWGPELHVVSVDSGRIYTWGEDPAAPPSQRSSTVRPDGGPGVIGVIDDGRVVWSVSLPVVETAMAVVAVPGDSLADVDGLQLAITALTDARVAEMALTDTPQAVPTDEVALAPVLFVGTGSNATTSELRGTIVLVHATPERTSDNAERLGLVVANSTSRRHGVGWSELLTLDRFSSEGRVLTIDAVVASPGLLVDALAGGDTLLAVREPG